MKCAVLVVAFTALARAVPAVNINRYSRQHKRDVFADQTYNELSISGGVAGDALAEAQEKLAGLPEDLTTVEEADLTFLNAVNQVANDAEVGGFNEEIVAAGAGEEALALQRGKIKNKVLKLEATVQMLTAQEAQGEDVAEKLAEEQTKLENNIAQDEAEAGNPATAVEFDANTADPEATEVAKDEETADEASDVVDASQALVADEADVE